jgi:hypothetical protein
MMEYNLASQFSVPVTSNKSTGELYAAMYEAQLRRSKFLDSQSRPTSSIIDSPFTEVRQ